MVLSWSVVTPKKSGDHQVDQAVVELEKVEWLLQLQAHSCWVCVTPVVLV